MNLKEKLATLIKEQGYEISEEDLPPNGENSEIFWVSQPNLSWEDGEELDTAIRKALSRLGKVNVSIDSDGVYYYIEKRR